jgi:hypothetical protein
MGAAGSRRTDFDDGVLDLNHYGTAWPMTESRKLNFNDIGDRALFIDAVHEAMQASQEFSFSDSTDAKLCAYLYSKELNFRVYFYNTPCYVYNGKKCRGVLISAISCLTYRDHQVDFIPEEEFNNLTLDDVPNLITIWQLITVF